jgi:ACS family tartrate transporter-like MFS transporter
LAEAFSDGRVWLLGGFFFCVLLAWYGYAFSAPALVQQVTGLSVGRVGFIIAGLGVAGALSMLGNGWDSDRTGERFWHIVTPLVLMAAGYVVVGLSVSPSIVLPGLVLVVAGNAAVQGPVWTIPAEFLQGKSAAAGVATINMLGILGGFVGPAWMGVSKDATGTLQRGLLTIAAPSLLAAVLMVILWRKWPPGRMALRAETQ